MGITIIQILDAIERLAPLSFQEDFDNSGLQVGLTDGIVTGVLVCLDVTEDVIDEAVKRGCNLVVSHHPLIFKALKQVSDRTWQQRCVYEAVRNGITIYSAHTSLDNAEGGVNHKIASLIGLRDLEWLEERPCSSGFSSGSGLIGELPAEEDVLHFIQRLKNVFGVDCIMHSKTFPAVVRKIALCGGAGSFLMDSALAKGADCFITGEISYHHYFDACGMLLVALGHYQSERFTINLLRDYLSGLFPSLRVESTSIDTNPIKYTL